MITFDACRRSLHNTPLNIALFFFFRKKNKKNINSVSLYEKEDDWHYAMGTPSANIRTRIFFFFSLIRFYVDNLAGLLNLPHISSILHNVTLATCSVLIYFLYTARCWSIFCTRVWRTNFKRSKSRNLHRNELIYLRAMKFERFLIFTREDRFDRRGYELMIDLVDL